VCRLILKLVECIMNVYRSISFIKCSTILFQIQIKYLDLLSGYNCFYVNYIKVGVWKYTIHQTAKMNDTVEVVVSSSHDPNTCSFTLRPSVKRGDGDQCLLLHLDITLDTDIVAGLHVKAVIESPDKNTVQVDLKDNGAGTEF